MGQKRIIIMRHAKAQPSTSGDHGRTLVPEGLRQAGEVGELIKLKGWVPMVVCSSDAARTRQTWDVLCGHFDPHPEPVFHVDLYRNGLATALRLISGLTEDVQTGMILGHNPDLEAIVHWLSGERVGMGTANAILLEGDFQSWEEVRSTKSLFSMREILRPRPRLA